MFLYDTLSKSCTSYFLPIICSLLGRDTQCRPTPFKASAPAASKEDRKIYISYITIRLTQPSSQLWLWTNWHKRTRTYQSQSHPQRGTIVRVLSIPKCLRRRITSIVSPGLDFSLANINHLSIAELRNEVKFLHRAEEVDDDSRLSRTSTSR
jgi:hypothetical protein